jgi:hypothetical protein
MRTVFRWLFWIFAVLYVIALLLFLIGASGLFGQERDPLSGVFLLPLGYPWIRLADGVGEAVRPWVLALAPLINLAILQWLAGLPARRSEPEK